MSQQATFCGTFTVEPEKLPLAFVDDGVRGWETVTVTPGGIIADEDSIVVQHNPASPDSRVNMSLPMGLERDTPLARRHGGHPWKVRGLRGI